MKTADIINELANLPVEERAFIADSLLQTLNHTQTEIEREWLEVAQQRLAEIEAGTVKTIPYDEVMSRLM